MGTPSQNFGPSVALFDQTLEEAFPKVDPRQRPVGSKVLVQIRAAKDVTRGGIIIPESAREAIAANTQVAKVVGLGPNCFKTPRGEPWPEGPWFAIGDYVRCPKFGGDRFEVPVPKSKGGEVVMFVAFDHLAFSCIVDDPLEVIAYI